jgi:Cdc6-like AAA superfamily ATPase
LTTNNEDWAALRFEAGQLFTPSTPIAVAELFAGRKKEINQLFEAVAERGRHVLLYGERGVGKTSLCQVVPLMLPRGARHILHIRKAADPTDDFSSIWKKIFSHIYVGTENERISLADIYGEKPITPNDVVQELSSFNENDVPIMVIDEFNEIGTPDASQLMANTIKGLSDAGVNATVVVVGVARNVTDLIEGHESISRCCEEVPMPRMNKDELKEVIERRVNQLGMQIEPNAKWKIINLSKGLPSFVHGLGKYSCYSAIDRKKRKVTEADVDEAIDAILESSQQTLKQAYEMAVKSNQPSARYQHVLTACALAKTDESGFFTQTAVREPLSAILQKNIEIGNLRPQLHELIEEERGSIIERVGEERGYRYRFADPAMQPYVIMAGIKSGLLPETAKLSLSSPEQTDLFSNVSLRPSSQ